MGWRTAQEAAGEAVSIQITEGLVACGKNLDIDFKSNGWLTEVSGAAPVAQW